MNIVEQFISKAKEKEENKKSFAESASGEIELFNQKKMKFNIYLEWNRFGFFRPWVVRVDSPDVSDVFFSVEKAFFDRSSAKDYFDLMVEDYNLKCAVPVKIETKRNRLTLFMAIFVFLVVIVSIYNFFY